MAERKSPSDQSFGRETAPTVTASTGVDTRNATAEGSKRVTTDAQIDNQLRIARRGMAKFRNALRTLAG